MTSRTVSRPLAQLPNALTIGRLVVIPVFAVLILSAHGGYSSGQLGLSAERSLQARSVPRDDRDWEAKLHAGAEESGLLGLLVVGHRGDHLHQPRFNGLGPDPDRPRGRLLELRVRVDEFDDFFLRNHALSIADSRPSDTTDARPPR